MSKFTPIVEESNEKKVKDMAILKLVAYHNALLSLEDDGDWLKTKLTAPDIWAALSDEVKAVAADIDTVHTALKTLIAEQQAAERIENDTISL